MGSSWPNWRAVADVTTTVASIIAAGGIIWAAVAINRAGSKDVPRPLDRVLSLPLEPVSLTGIPTTGNKAAKVAIIEFGDFQCPACTRFALTTFPGLVNRFVSTGMVLFAYRHYPLERIHPLAFKAAEAADCAGRQGHFWEMAGALFAASPRIEPPQLQQLATSLGLAAPAFAACLNGEVASDVRSSIADARTLKLSSVPVFMFGTVQQDGRVKVTSIKPGGTAEPEDFLKIVDAFVKDPGAGPKQRAQ